MIQRLKLLVRRMGAAKTQRRLVAAGAKVGPETAVSPRFGFRIHPTARVEVGACSVLDGRLVVTAGGVIRIGHHCSFRTGMYIGCAERVEIGDHVFGAEGVFITDNNNHPVSPAARREMTLSPPNSSAWKWDRPDVSSAPVVIESDVWLGRRSVILKGVTIGRGSIVAAGAVVTRSVPPFSVVAGNPARVVKTLNDDLPPVISSV